jgi:hypothetical protein
MKHVDIFDKLPSTLIDSNCLTKFPLGLKLKPSKCLGFHPFQVSCLKFHSLSWRGVPSCEGIYPSFFNLDFSPYPTFEKPSIFMMASNNEGGQFSSSLRLAQVEAPSQNGTHDLTHACARSQT